MSNPFKQDNDADNQEIQDIQEDINNQENIDNQENTTDDSDIQESSLSDNENPDMQKKYEELNNQYIRLAADFDNYRKRQAQERESLLKYGAESTLKKIIEVLDNFERGEKANETVEDCEKVKESFNLVHKQLIDVLSKAGLEHIEAEGQEFDPIYHEAVMQTPTSEYPEHTIIAELQKGYKMGDRVLRPALVNVATSE